MANYDHILRVVIRKPTTLHDWCEALDKLNDAKQRLHILQMAAEQGIIPQMIFDSQMRIISDLICQATRLAGFNNPEDMKYFIENFQNL